MAKEKSESLSKDNPTIEPITESQPPEVPASEPETPAVDSSLDPFEDIAESLTAGKPEAQEHFVDIVKSDRQKKHDQATVEESGGDWGFLKDSSGKYWRADICENKVDPKTGIPAKTASGLWKLKRSASAKDRKKLSTRPPNIEAKQANADSAAQAQAVAEAEAAALVSRAAIYTAGIMKTYKAGLSKMSGEEAVSQVLGMKFGEGQYEVKVEDVISRSLVQVLLKFNGGPELTPGITLLAATVATTGAVFFHPSKPERKTGAMEKAGVLWRRIKNRKSSKKATVEEPGGVS